MHAVIATLMAAAAVATSSPEQRLEQAMHGVEPRPAPAGAVAVVGRETIARARLDALLTASRASWDAAGIAYPAPRSAKALDLRRQAVEQVVKSSKTRQAAAAIGVTGPDEELPTAVFEKIVAPIGGGEDPRASRRAKRR
jgi:hypothetical protein